MNRLQTKAHNQTIRRQRVRSRISGTNDRPRLSVSISLRHITAQVIDDSKNKTLVYVSTVGARIDGKSMTERGAWVGKKLAEKASKQQIKKVAFDRGSKLYHGRLKALAEAARAEGMEF